MASAKFFIRFRSLVHAALCLCVTLPLHLFCDCACASSCCLASHSGSVSRTDTASRSAAIPADKSKSCCSHCPSNEPVQAVKSNSLQQNRDRTEQPCHCLAQRAQFGFLKNDAQSSLSDLHQSYFAQVPSFFSFEVESPLLQSRQLFSPWPLAHNRRLAQLGVWLN